MAQKVSYEVHPKEKFYFALKVFFSSVFYLLVVGGAATTIALVPDGGKFLAVVLAYIMFFILIIIFELGFFVGYLRGNAIKITEAQFPDIYDTIRRQSMALGLVNIPDAYVLQAGGLLNAFATKFMGRDYVVIFSDILEEAYENNKETVEFVIAHELGHVVRNHITKNMILLPSIFVPFLHKAYSRGCEYTCDRIGAALSPKGAITGLVVLAAGKKLYKRVDVQVFADQAITEGGFWTWIAEKFSTHPKLSKRVAEFTNRVEFIPPAKVEARKETVKEYSSDDHSKYMPGT